ncbi:MAG: BamA/TamA family outer membrane protein [Gammaproteobacteria bacterium]|nr:BamA/TamA family outer membrane protein [Gammaproteobacteria bacterium]MDH5799658.1 BamA/TamA family outer membrane protein [Gammaproteobacteria bacterium]
MCTTAPLVNADTNSAKPLPTTEQIHPNPTPPSQLSTQSPTPPITPESKPASPVQDQTPSTQKPPRESPSPTQPQAEQDTLDGNTTVFGNIEIQSNDVFDTSNPKESHWFYRTVNFLHVNTKDHVIRNLLLFKTGDPFSVRQLQETERLLRGNSYLYDAAITVLGKRDDKIDVRVSTQDAWTLTGGVSFNRSGGENRSSFDLEERNLFGVGKTLKVRRSFQQNRTGTLFEYYDPALGLRHLEFRINFTNNSDGEKSEFILTRPFYSLDSRRAISLQAVSFTRDERLYENGMIINAYKQTEEDLEIFGGFSSGLKNNKALRWRYGFHYSRNIFRRTIETMDATLIPSDKTLSYPWFETQSLENRFIKMTRIDHIARTEDLNLGTQYRLRLGMAHPEFGSDRSALLWEANTGSTFRFFSQNIASFSVESTGRMGNHKSENATVIGRSRYFLPLQEHQTLYANLELELGYNLDRETQLLLGGDKGLRGYPSNYQSGNRKLLLNLESRFYSNVHLWQLFHVGGLVFFDVGYAWNTGSTDWSDVLKDAGIGLRLASSRSGRGKILHLDLAFPLDGDPSIERRQFLVSTYTHF